jgi:Fe2+ or Zn2+ uptake regulation protein
MEAPTELAGLFRSRGLKVTPQRECIFRVLHGNEEHPTAESVHAEARREMPMMSLKTVYQTLNDLAEMGQIAQLDLGTGSSRFDPNVDLHHHLVCTGCGKVRDVYPSVEVTVPESEQQGFVVGTTDVILRGLCLDCQS